MHCLRYYVCTMEGTVRGTIGALCKVIRVQCGSRQYSRHCRCAMFEAVDSSLPSCLVPFISPQAVVLLVV